MERPVSDQALAWCEARVHARGGGVWTSENTGRHYWGRNFADACARQMADEVRRGEDRPVVDTLHRRDVS